MWSGSLGGHWSSIKDDADASPFQWWSRPQSMATPSTIFNGDFGLLPIECWTGITGRLKCVRWYLGYINSSQDDIMDTSWHHGHASTLFPIRWVSLTLFRSQDSRHLWQCHSIAYLPHCGNIQQQRYRHKHKWFWVDIPNQYGTITPYHCNIDNKAYVWHTRQQHTCIHKWFGVDIPGGSSLSPWGVSLLTLGGTLFPHLRWNPARGRIVTH